MSTSGAANSNAQWQSGATQGADRAAERSGGLELKPSIDAEAAVKGKGSTR